MTEAQGIAWAVLQDDEVVVPAVYVLQGFMEEVLNGVVVVLAILLPPVEQVLAKLTPPPFHFDVTVMVDGRLQHRMVLHVGMPHAVDGDVVQAVAVVVLQVEVHEIFHRSPLHGRNRQDARCQDCNLHRRVHSSEFTVHSSQFLPVEYFLAVLKMEEVDNLGKAVVGELLPFVFKEAEGHLADERRPAGIAADRAYQAVAERKGVEVEDGPRRLASEAPAGAALEAVSREVLVRADEERHAPVVVQLLDAEHELAVFLQLEEEATVVPRRIVATTNMDADHEVGVLSKRRYQPFGFLHDAVLRSEDALQLWQRLRQVTGVAACAPPLGKAQEAEHAVPPFVVRHLPRQAFVVVPSVATLQVPLMVEREPDERAMEKIWEVLDGPVEEDDGHLLMFGHTLRHALNVGPQSVARLSRGITDYSHIFSKCLTLPLILKFVFFLRHFHVFILLTNIVSA